MCRAGGGFEANPPYESRLLQVQLHPDYAEVAVELAADVPEMAALPEPVLAMKIDTARVQGRYAGQYGRVGHPSKVAVRLNNVNKCKRRV